MNHLPEMLSGGDNAPNLRRRCVWKIARVIQGGGAISPVDEGVFLELEVLVVRIETVEKRASWFLLGKLNFMTLLKVKTLPLE